MSKHTPGPWMISGTTVYALMHDSWWRCVEQFRNRFYVNVQVDRECPQEEAIANARLIAAAPELLEALHLVRMSMAWQALSNESRQVVESAIAKATGAE